jgi:hypothetical protein
MDNLYDNTSGGKQYRDESLREANHAGPRAGFTRKEVLKVGMLGGAALLVPLGRPANTTSVANRIPASGLPEPFRVPFAAPAYETALLRRAGAACRGDAFGLLPEREPSWRGASDGATLNAQTAGVPTG